MSIRPTLPIFSDSVRTAIRFPPVALQAASVLSAGLVGLIAGARPTLTIGVALAGALFVLVMGSMAVGLGILIVAGFLEQFSEIAGAISIAKAVGALLALGWLVIMLRSRPDMRHQRDIVAGHPAFASVLVVFVAWAATSALWAERAGTAVSTASRFALDLALFPIVFAGLRRRSHLVALMCVFVAAALGSVVYGLLARPDPNSPTIGRLSGAGLNPNQLGGHLVAAIVFATALALVKGWPWFGRCIALLAAAGCAAGLYMTESRGALFFGFGSALLVTPLAAGRGRRLTAGTLTILAVLATVGWFAFIAPPAAVHRITHPEAAGGSGRKDLWTVGVRMAEAHPLWGVGVGNFPANSVHYLFRPGTTQRDIYIVDRPSCPTTSTSTYSRSLGLSGWSCSYRS